MRLFRQLRKADVVVVVRKLFGRVETRVLRWYAQRLVFDFDDAIIYRDSRRKNPFSRSRAKRFGVTVRAADLVIAGNAYLAGLVERFGGRPSVVPTCVDDELLTPGDTSRRAGGRVVIGWLGSASTLMYLESLRPALEQLGKRYGSCVVLKVVCDRFPDRLGVEMVRKPWTLNDERDDLRSFDIGIMPLTDDVWTRGKCGFKLLQYMAVGVPVVASAVGVNREIIRHGENGFIADDPEAWVKLLGRLIEDVELRKRIGVQGQRSLSGRYTVSDWVGRYHPWAALMRGAQVPALREKWLFRQGAGSTEREAVVGRDSTGQAQRRGVADMRGGGGFPACLRCAGRLAARPAPQCEAG